jgi:hypothetical protein
MLSVSSPAGQPLTAPALHILVAQDAVFLRHAIP